MPPSFVQKLHAGMICQGGSESELTIEKEDYARLQSAESNLREEAPLYVFLPATSRKVGRPVTLELQSQDQGEQLKVVLHYEPPDALASHVHARLLWERQRNAQLMRELESALQELELRETSQRELLRGLSHELKTPLSPIVGIASVLEDRFGDTEEAELVKLIGTSATEATHLIEALLSPSHSKTGSQPEPVRFPAFLEEVIAEYRPNLQARGVAFRLLGPWWKGRGVTVLADESRMRLILRKLLRHASRTVSGGHVTLSVEADQTGGDCLDAKIRLIDTGRGLDGFQSTPALETVSNLAALKDPATGKLNLDLAVAHGLVRRSGGELDYRVLADKKNCFEWRLSLKIVRSEQLAKPATTAPIHLPQAASILVAEDDPASAQALLNIIRGQGWQADWARDGLEALECFRRSAYDVVLADVQMPGLDGIQLSREIRRIDHNKSSAIIAISSFSLQDLILTDAGIDAYIEKPLVPETVSRAIYTQLRRYQRSAS